MKKFKYVVLFSVVFSLSACSFNTEDSTVDEIANTITESVSNIDILDGANDVLSYVQNTQQSFQEVMNVSTQWTEVFNSARNGEITNEELATQVKNEILPLNEELMAQIENFTPPTEATAYINDLLVNAVTSQHDALLDVVDGIQNGDHTVLDSANQLLSDVGSLEGEFTKMIENIMTEYGF